MRSRRPWLSLVAILTMLGVQALDQPSAQAQTAPRGTLSRYVAADFWGAIVIHPARVAKSPLWADLPKSAAMPMTTPPGMDPAQAAALMQAAKELDPTKIRRVVVLLEGKPQANTSSAAIVQFEDDLSQKWVDLLTKGGQAAEHQGTKYMKLKMPTGPELAACAPDPKILLVGTEPALQRALTMPAGAQPLLEELRRVSLENDILAAVLFEPLLKAAGDQIPPTMKPMAEGLKSAAATINFSGDTLLHVDLMAAKEETAAGLQKQLSMFPAMGVQQAQAMKPMLPPQLAAALFPVLEEMAAGTKVNKDGLRVTADMKMPAKLADLLKSISSMASSLATPPAMPPAAPPEPPRVPSKLSPAAPPAKPAPK